MKPITFEYLPLDPELKRELRELAAFHNQFAGMLFSGTGDPENVVKAGIGALYMRRDGGAGTTLYVKESDDGLNTGWAGK